jgi:predicted kinase
MEKVLILLRGLPGAGKSSLAEILPGHTCIADDYHMVNGKYEWKPENVRKSHTECQSKCERLMKMGSTPIKIANTLTTKKEMNFYYKLAEKHNYKVFTIIVENRMKIKNVHSVPDETIEKMRIRFDISL